MVAPVMQLVEMRRKNIWHGARERVMTRQRYVKSPCNVEWVFLFLNAATFWGISGQTHGVNI